MVRAFDTARHAELQQALDLISLAIVPAAHRRRNAEKGQICHLIKASLNRLARDIGTDCSMELTTLRCATRCRSSPVRDDFPVALRKPVRARYEVPTMKLRK